MVDIELRELRLFLVLAEELHFGRAAEQLRLTTSRASQTLRALERKLGGRRLFDRTSRVVTLTAAGHALHDEPPRPRHLVATVEQVVASHPQPAGRT
jgi:DNA-binding transcriptional LysR family regulator